MFKRFTDPKIEMLSGIQVLRGARRAQLRELCAHTTQVDFSAGSALCRQGQVGAEMFLIIEGQLQVERDGQPIAQIGPGEIVGEISLLSRRPRTATVRALGPVKALVLNRREFDMLTEIYDLAGERIDTTGVRRQRELATV